MNNFLKSSLISKEQNIAKIDKVIAVSADKSISHRALIFAAIANGKSKIFNLLEGEDVINTANALRLMGVEINKFNSCYEVNGVGLAGLREPIDVLQMGNSGTSTRLLAGLVSTYGFSTFFTGDASLRKRPMGRIFDPISMFGAKIISRSNENLPFAIIGNKNSTPIQYLMKNASAQVKSCILLAALKTRGLTTIIEPELSRDHSEIMMKYLGISINVQNIEINSKIGKKIELYGFQDFAAKNFEIPSDISSVAFFIVLALIIENTSITVKSVVLNPLRTGIIETLIEMGADIKISNKRELNGEVIGNITARSSKLKGIDIPAGRAASMIDEYPILSIAAANAVGTTKMKGLSELKVKESNRLLMISNNLELCGVTNKIDGDDLIIEGGIAQPKKLVNISSAMDHRIAMSFLIMGLKIEKGIKIDDCSVIATSFPNFFDICKDLSINFITE